MLLQDSGTAASRASHGSIQLGRSLAHPTVMRTGILGRAAKLLLSRIGLRRLGRSLALPIGVRTGILGRAKLRLSRIGLRRLGRSLALPIGVRSGILGRAKLRLSRIGLRQLGRSLAIPIGVYPRGTYDDFLREAISPELSQYTNINPRRGTSPC
jgi:hypothetical protein